MWVSREEYKALKRDLERLQDIRREFPKQINFLIRENGILSRKVERMSEEYLESSKKIYKIKKELEHYLDTKQKNGVVYIPKFVIEKIVYDR